MKVLSNYRNCPEALRGAALAIGNFDGVHRGHQAVLEAARAAAAGVGAHFGVMTFEPHPRQFFKPDVPLFRLTPPPLKLELFEVLGVELAVVLPFNAALAALGAETFVTEILVECLGVSQVVTGADLRFGRARAGDTELMRKLGDSHGFSITVVEAARGEGGICSSSDVRARLGEGDPAAAAEILGYWWRIAGTVVGGDKRGHGLGFPTANVAVPPGFGLKHGIYAVRVYLDGRRWHGAAYLGTRPSFDDGPPVIETFLFDFSDSVYGKDIEIEVIAFLRDDEKFDSVEKLKQQMHADCAEAEEILERIDRDDPMRRYPLGRALAG